MGSRIMPRITYIGIVNTSDSTENHKDAIRRSNRQYAEGEIEDLKSKGGILLEDSLKYSGEDSKVKLGTDDLRNQLINIFIITTMYLCQYSSKNLIPLPTLIQ